MGLAEAFVSYSYTTPQFPSLSISAFPFLLGVSFPKVLPNLLCTQIFVRIYFQGIWSKVGSLEPWLGIKWWHWSLTFSIFSGNVPQLFLSYHDLGGRDFWTCPDQYCVCIYVENLEGYTELLTVIIGEEVKSEFLFQLYKPQNCLNIKMKMH